MIGMKITCTQCQTPLTYPQQRCPRCKSTIPKKQLETFKKAESHFWLIFLTGLAVSLSLPILFFDFLGNKGTGLTIVGGIALSFLIAYYVMFTRVYGTKK